MGQFLSTVGGNIDNGANADCHDELEDSVKVVNTYLDQDFVNTNEAVLECASDEVDGPDQEQEPIILTEDTFTHNVEMDSQQAMSVEGVEDDDTNNNETLQSRNDNGVEENTDVNTIEDEESNISPKFKECEVKINRLNMKSFEMMRKCSVNVKRLDQKFDNIAQDLQMESDNNLNQRCSSQSSSSDVARQTDNTGGQSQNREEPSELEEREEAEPQETEEGNQSEEEEETRKIYPWEDPARIMQQSTGSNLSSNTAPFDRDNAQIGRMMSPVEEKDASENMNISKTSERGENAVATPIDGDIGSESRNSTVILYSANCDEFFSSVGHAHSTGDDQEDSSLHKVDGNSASDHTYSVTNVGKGDVINEEEENDEGNEGDMADTIKKNRRKFRNCIERCPDIGRSPTATKEKPKSKATSKISSSGSICTFLESVHAEDELYLGDENHEHDLIDMIEDTHLAPVSTSPHVGSSKSLKNQESTTDGEEENEKQESTTDDEEENEKQIEQVPKIRIKRNFIQQTQAKKTSERLIESSDDENIESQEESPKKKAKMKSKQWRPYSKEEDENIVRYMKEAGMRGRQRGRKNWQLMEEENICPGRTWQSMKERWIKHIERKLCKNGNK